MRIELKRLREQKRIKQETLSYLMGHSIRYYQRYEHGFIKSLSRQNERLLAVELNITLDKLREISRIYREEEINQEFRHFNHQALKDLRFNHGFTMEEVQSFMAKDMKNYSNLENGLTKTIKPNYLLRLAKLYKIDIKDLEKMLFD